MKKILATLLTTVFALTLSTSAMAQIENQIEEVKIMTDSYLQKITDLRLYQMYMWM